MDEKKTIFKCLFFSYNLAKAKNHFLSEKEGLWKI